MALLGSPDCDRRRLHVLVPEKGYSSPCVVICKGHVQDVQGIVHKWKVASRLTIFPTGRGCFIDLVHGKFSVCNAV